jgi:hypothetical protein
MFHDRTFSRPKGMLRPMDENVFSRRISTGFSCKVLAFQQIAAKAGA